MRTKAALEDRGVPALLAHTVHWARHWIEREPPVVALVDLEVRDAWSLVEELRRRRHHVLAISEDRAARQRALEQGCHDAVCRSVGPDELALKVARMARTSVSQGPIRMGKLIVDPGAGRVLWGDRCVTDSPLLVRLAACLAAGRGELVPIRSLLDEVWGEPWAGSEKVRRAIWRLRRSLELHGAGSKLLVGRRGQGYALVRLRDDRSDAEHRPDLSRVRSRRTRQRLCFASFQVAGS